jgi:hypothetical protein
MPVAVLYDRGAVSPTEIAAAAASLGSLIVVLGPSDHAQRMRRFFADTCSAVHDLADPKVIDALRGVAGITTFSEAGLIPAARLATALGLRGHAAATAHRLTDKRAQRAALRAAGVDATASVLLDDPADWADAVRTVGLPAVVKPVHGVSSRNTVLVEDLATGRAELARVLAAEGPVVVEEYLRGAPVPEPFGDYVSVESVVQDGDRCHLSVTGKLRLAPPFRECGQFWPARLDAATEQAVLTLTDRAVAALGVTTGVLHTELKLTPDGPRIIEVNGRIGGYIADLAARAGGVDLVEVATRIARGDRVDLAPVRPDRVFFQFTTPAPVATGTVAAADRGRELRGVPGITGYHAFVRPGTPVGGVGTLDLNLITGDVPDHEALAAVTETIFDTVSYEFEFGSGRERRTARDLVYRTTEPRHDQSGTVQNGTGNDEQEPRFAESTR